MKIAIGVKSYIAYGHILSEQSSIEFMKKFEPYYKTLDPEDDIDYELFHKLINCDNKNIINTLLDFFDELSPFSGPPGPLPFNWYKVMDKNQSPAILLVPGVVNCDIYNSTDEWDGIDFLINTISRKSLSSKINEFTKFFKEYKVDVSGFQFNWLIGMAISSNIK